MTRPDPEPPPVTPVRPVPIDDGQARHLPGMAIPRSVSLPATTGASVSLGRLKGLTVAYCYPRTAELGKPLPPGWDAIPGASGCTAQNIDFRDRYHDLLAQGVDRVFGISTQYPAYQAEVAARLRLPFPLLSDLRFDLLNALDLPRFSAGGLLLKRTVMVIRDGVIAHVIYPVFPPEDSAKALLKWLMWGPRSPAPRARPRRRRGTSPA